jgi:hypothetical protein
VVILGTALIPMTAVICRKYGEYSMWVAAILTTTSLFLIQYASEARGYGYLVFFVVASHGALQQFVDTRKAWWLVAYSAACVLGLFSHLAFVVVFSGHFVLMSSEWMSRRIRWQEILRWGGLGVLPSMLLLTWMWKANISHMTVGGGDKGYMGETVIQVFAIIAGSFHWGTESIVIGIVFGLALLLASYQTLPTAMSQILNFVATVGTLLALVVWRDEDFLYPRYFLVAVPLTLILLAIWLGVISKESRSVTIISVALLIAVVSGNLWQTLNLIRYGRGNYLAALQLINDRTQGDEVLIASDHAFRNGLLIDYYVPKLENPKVWPKLAREQQEGIIQSPRPAEWFILHNGADSSVVPQKEIFDAQGRRFEFVQNFRHSGLSGFSWAVYHVAEKEASVQRARE